MGEVNAARARVLMPVFVLRDIFVVVTCFVALVNCDTTINKLTSTIASLQVKEDSTFSYLPPSWNKLKGSYPNDVKLNFHGPLDLYLLRDVFAVPDVNMFTSAWITACLIEAYEYGKAPKPSSNQLQLALNAMDKFRNRNVQYQNSEMTFWPQTMNKSAEYYQSFPENLMGLMKLPDYMPEKFMEDFLKWVGLKDIAHVMDMLLKEKDTFAAAFHIPPDFDDTFVNIGVGSLLRQFQADFPTNDKLWTQQNSNLKSVFDKVKKYAYRPFSNDSRQNTIDPRTYMYLHKFIERAVNKGQDVAIITTWLQDTEEVKTLLDKGVAMPFNVNNVDITVAANFIYGVATCLGSNVCSPDLIDHGIQQIFVNSTALIAYEIQSNLSSRPDLALTYYPSKFEFYWFVSRTFAFLNRFLQHLEMDNGLMEMMGYAYTTLWPVLREDMTRDVLGSIQTMDGDSFIENFLGCNDTNIYNKTIDRAEDRIFSTAVSVNALINTWTKLDNTSLTWENDTPKDVKLAVTKMAAFLDNYILSSHYKTYNTFFSGSGKGAESMPFFYPANRMEYFNGTKFDDKTFPSGLKNIIGMEGYVTPQTYEKMLQKTHFGMKTPIDFTGYNSGKDGFFPFWTSDAYTYATTLVALSHFENIV